VVLATRPVVLGFVDLMVVVGEKRGSVLVGVVGWVCFLVVVE